MLELIKGAIAAKDYQNAEKFLEQLQQQNEENPWIYYYRANIKESKGYLAAATAEYRQLLQNTDVPKIISSTRQAIERIEKITREKKQAEIDRALAEPENQLAGVLILEPIPPEAKQTAAQQFAKIMNLDPYTARMQLPSRTWRLYRTGKIGELKLQVEALQQAQIPCFCEKIAEITAIKVLRVEYIKASEPTVKIIAANSAKESENITFKWPEITQKVDGLLPLFEASFHADPGGNHYRKTETLDYVRISDLHLSSQNTILRFGDFNYQFQQGIDLIHSGKNQSTNRENWNQLNSFLQKKVPQTTNQTDFNKFAEIAIDRSELLTKIKPQINLLRREESLWDNAFEIYSRLIFLKNTHNKTNLN